MGSVMLLAINQYRKRVMAGCASAFLLVHAPATADQPEVRISADSQLQFGTFMVFGAGSRTVSATGAVSDRSLVALEGTLAAPASFTVSYDRGNQNKHVLDIELELVLSPVSQFREKGVAASLSAFETTLPGALQIMPGRAFRVSLPNCRTRVCSRSFTVGARMDVSRDYGGADVVVPLLIDAAVISADRVR